MAEALRQLWQQGGFKSRQVCLGVGNQRVVVREIALPYLPEKELRAVARLPGAGVHPDAGGRGGPRLRPDRGVRAGRPPDAADAPGRGAARDGRPGRAGGERRPSSSRWGSTSSRSRSSARSGRPTWRSTSRRPARRPSSTSARTSRTSSSTRAATTRFVRILPRGWPRHHRRDRARCRDRGRRRGAAQARPRARGRARGTRARGRPRGRAAARRGVRRRDPLLARVLHGAGPRRADRAGARSPAAVRGSRVSST